jgi:TolB-like protein/tetratricopeptide (TPR) repeat protein
LAAAAAVVTLVYALAPRHREAPPPPGGAARADAMTLAVLPLQNLSGDPAQEFFADGMTEALITDLAKIEALRVISRASVMLYKGSRRPVTDVGRELGAAWILEGSIARDPERVRITATLVEARDGARRWTESYDRELKDVLTLQSDVASTVARAVHAALTPADETRLAARRTLRPEAHEAYLHGRAAWNKRTKEGFEDAIRFFEQAVASDPRYPEAYAGLADSYNFLGAYDRTPRNALARARRAAERAVALDGTLAETHTSLAWARFRADWDWPGAELSFKRALALNPGYATAHQWYASFLSTLGRHDEAIAESRRSLSLDPQSPIMHRSLAVVYYLARRYAEAEGEARQALGLEPESPAGQLTLARIRAARGDVLGAIAACEKIPEGRRTDDFAAFLGYFQARAGRRPEALAALERMRAAAREGRATAHDRALLHLGLGEHDAALEALGDSVDERSPFVLGLSTQPILDPLRGDARFQALVRRVGLPS